MSRFEPQIHCTNPACLSPLNLLGRHLCEGCQTPVTERYLWAVGPVAAQISPGDRVAGRYHVIAPQIWLDTQPGMPGDSEAELPQEVMPYLRLHNQRLHIPEVFGWATLNPNSQAKNILLLENAPIDGTGHLYPTIEDVWSKAMPVRQVYWLWQIWQLWTPLAELGLVSSLLEADNLRVQGWRVWLLELKQAGVGSPESEVVKMEASRQASGFQQVSEKTLTSLQNSDQPSLQQLGECWMNWAVAAQAPVIEPLKAIAQQLTGHQVELELVGQQLNQLLLSFAAELPIRLQVAGATDTGPQREHNEDNCYPTAQDAFASITKTYDPPIPNLAIVCDGIGGHEGGEVASQLAVQSLKLQIRALLKEVSQQTEIVSPQLLQDQLEAILRVVNNLIAARNNLQGRSERQRMGTTLVMALQVPQRVQTSTGWDADNGHELYLVHVGDSRAYWITPNYCIPLTIDDSVAVREVRAGRSLYQQAMLRQDGGALVQALGTRDAEFLRPTLQRFILEEDGLLLLCSDGLSDNGWVEQSWRDYATPVLKGELTLEDAVRQLIHQANLKNGHDNTSVVVMYCRMSTEYPVPVTPKLAVVESLESEFSEASKALMVAEPVANPEPTIEPMTKVSPQRRQFKAWFVLLGLILLLAGGSAGGVFALWRFKPRQFQHICRRLPKPLNQVCPPSQPVLRRKSSAI